MNCDHFSNTTIAAQDFTILVEPTKFRATILELIESAKERIYISALYLENDDAGNEVLEALYQAKTKNSDLDIKVFIDFHRAQRGLVGCDEQCGNISGYHKMNKKYDVAIEIYGVPVTTVEILGVLHLKGFVFDDKVLYSGASLNNIYLNYNDKYRIDRYFLIQSRALSDSFVNYFQTNFLNDNGAVTRFVDDQKISIKPIKKTVKKFSKSLSKSFYGIDEEDGSQDINLTPLFGLGKRKNKLNKTILELIKNTETKLTIYTPYFNLPGKVSRAIVKLLKRKSVEVQIIIGDKRANDFFIDPEEDFRKISVVPYIYEINLKMFVKKHSKFIDAGSLNINLWKDGINTFHLKGVESDDKYRLLTGNNLNPRGWGLDMENGILVKDSKKLLNDQFKQEHEYIMNHCTRIDSVDSFDTLDDYPVKVKTYIRYIFNTRAVKIIKKLM